MVDEIQKLMEEYWRGLRDRVVLRQVGDVVEITTPYLDRRNDYLQIYIKRQNDEFLITDNGYIIDNLEMSGCQINSPKQRALLQTMLAGFDVRRQDNALEVCASVENFSSRKHNLIQALLSVDNLFYTAHANSTSGICAADELKIAVLIDGDNISPKKDIGFVFEYTAARGEVLIKQVFVSDIRPCKGWENYDIDVKTVNDCKPGDSKCDYQLMKAAVDLTISSPAINCFCIVSNDSDFIPLMFFLRAVGKKTIGLGRSNAVKLLKESCDEYAIIVKNTVVVAPKIIDNQTIISVRKVFVDAMKDQALKKYISDKGWINLGVLGTFLKEHNLLAHYTKKRVSEWAALIGLDIQHLKSMGMYVRDNSDTWIPPVESIN